MALRPIGRLIHAGADGLLPRQGRAPTALWQPVLDALITELRTDFPETLVSIALRGSVSRATDVAGVSDLDLVAFFTQNPPQDITLTSGLMPDLQIEVCIEHMPGFLTAPSDHWMRFALAFSGWTLWGRDIVAALPAPQLGDHCIAHLKAASRWLGDWQVYWDAEQDEAEHRAICQWLMKRMVRALFETQINTLNAYSRDIYPCAMAAIDAFPAYETAILTAAERAIAPSANKAAVQDIADALSPLLLSEQAKRSHVP